MDLQEKIVMLESIINEISMKGHDELLLQQLIKCYLDIYLARYYQSLGEFIDSVQNRDENSSNYFFGQIIKAGKGATVTTDSLTKTLINGFYFSLVHTIIQKNETLKQIYTNLGVLNKDLECHTFWWTRVLNTFADADFSDLCQIVPNSDLTNGNCHILFIRENDLRTLLNEKGIPEEEYSISYGTMYGGRVYIAGTAMGDLRREEIKKQQQKGLYLHKVKVGTAQQ